MEMMYVLLLYFLRYIMELSLILDREVFYLYYTKYLSAEYIVLVGDYLSLDSSKNSYQIHNHKGDTI